MGRTGIGLLLWLALAAPVAAQTTDTAPAAVPTGEETRALLEAARETAKATRESVDYARVMPDILQQILAKLDKLEDKLDKVENAIKAQAASAGRKR